MKNLQIHHQCQQKNDEAYEKSGGGELLYETLWDELGVARDPPFLSKNDERNLIQIYIQQNVLRRIRCCLISPLLSTRPPACCDTVGVWTQRRLLEGDKDRSIQHATRNASWFVDWHSKTSKIITGPLHNEKKLAPPYNNEMIPFFAKIKYTNIF